MSSYFHVSTTPRRPLQTDTFTVETRGAFDSAPLDDSIYVFPNPSSTPASPSQFSDISAPTDLTSSSAISETPSESNGLPGIHDRQFDPHSSLSPISSLEDVHDTPWTPKAADEVLLRASSDSMERIDRWQQLIRGRAKQSMNSRSRSRSRDVLKACNRTFDSQPSIPMLTCFVSLFAVDEATLHLLSRSSDEAALFPGQSLLPDSVRDGADEVHGMEKLLTRRSESCVIRDSCTLVSDSYITPYHPFSSLPFVGLWGLVTGFIINSGKAFREVLES